MLGFQNELIDDNLHETIIDCNIKRLPNKLAQIIVIYENGQKERIWTFDATRYSFDYMDFIGMSKIEAVFYCDRKRSNQF